MATVQVAHHPEAKHGEPGPDDERIPPPDDPPPDRRGEQRQAESREQAGAARGAEKFSTENR